MRVKTLYSKFHGDSTKLSSSNDFISLTFVYLLLSAQMVYLKLPEVEFRRLEDLYLSFVKLFEVISLVPWQ